MKVGALSPGKRPTRCSKQLQQRMMEAASALDFEQAPGTGTDWKGWRRARKAEDCLLIVFAIRTFSAPSGEGRTHFSFALSSGREC